MTEEALDRARQADDVHRENDHDGALEFWFDPSCPFTWRTSVWLRDVVGRHGSRVDWHLMSLAALNEGRAIPEELQDSIRQGARALRVLAAAADRGGSSAVGRLYEAIGTRWHDHGEGPGDGLVRAALADADLPVELADAAEDPSLDDVVRQSHDRGQERVGTEVGSPILALPGRRGYFGPVVVPPPTGDDADRLFEAIRLLSSVPSFSEVKTNRASL